LRAAALYGHSRFTVHLLRPSLRALQVTAVRTRIFYPPPEAVFQRAVRRRYFFAW